MPSTVSRILTVVELLQSHGQMSGPDLARRLGVDARTLRRYVVQLEAMGIPVTAERGRYGAYRLVSGFKLPPMMFTDDEALALSVGLVAARKLGLAGAAAAVESAQAKLERVLPEPLKARLRALSRTVTLDLPASPAAHNNETLNRLGSAAHARQRVRLRYRSPQADAFRESEREFDVYGLGWRSGRWYAVGWCHLRRDLRSFRLDRIAQIALVNGHFDAPESFDAMAYLAHRMASLPRAIGVVVLLKTDLNTARDALFEAIGVFQPCDAGVLLHSQVDDLKWYARQLARLPFAFEVQSPDALRGALIACANELIAMAKP
jgi:predicted DNA-binding transcriptional regulator YafY